MTTQETLLVLNSWL